MPTVLYVGLLDVCGKSQSRLTEDKQPYQEPGYEISLENGKSHWISKSDFKDYQSHIWTKLEGNSVSEPMVRSFIANIETRDIGNKTTCVVATLVNGFEITATSACVDPDNYCRAIGEEICMKQIYDKVYELLGFLLQTAKYGFGGTTNEE